MDINQAIKSELKKTKLKLFEVETELRETKQRLQQMIKRDQNKSKEIKILEMRLSNNKNKEKKIAEIRNKND